MKCTASQRPTSTVCLHDPMADTGHAVQSVDARTVPCLSWNMQTSSLRIRTLLLQAVRTAVAHT
jgi:hypothetical protein